MVTKVTKEVLIAALSPEKWFRLGSGTAIGVILDLQTENSRTFAPMLLADMSVALIANGKSTRYPQAARGQYVLSQIFAALLIY